MCFDKLIIDHDQRLDCAKYHKTNRLNLCNEICFDKLIMTSNEIKKWHSLDPGMRCQIARYCPVLCGVL